MKKVLPRTPTRHNYLSGNETEAGMIALTPIEKAEIEALHGRDIDQWFLEGRDKGYYVGWRGVIGRNGAWTSFVSGD